ncbi:hypothetical protein SLA2020_302530 [Shorea laevis]
MAGVSLKCGDCGALLKSAQEAQEHAELTSHSNFSESTEAVLNLVCTACGKPCRSKTESDLHTKRTGHTEFVDKTSEAAKPINLEAPKIVAESEEAVDASSSSQSEEMVVPEVDKKLLEELKLMGFPTAHATRALHYSGNSSLAAAVNWVVDHENDPDIDQVPVVPLNSKVEAPKPSLAPEEMKLKAQELSGLYHPEAACPLGFSLYANGGKGSGLTKRRKRKKREWKEKRKRRGFEWARNCWKQSELRKKMRESVCWPCRKQRKRKRKELGKKFVRNWRKTRLKEGGGLGCLQKILQLLNLHHLLWRRKRFHCQLGQPQRQSKCENVYDLSSKITR